MVLSGFRLLVRWELVRWGFVRVGFIQVGFCLDVCFVRVGCCPGAMLFDGFGPGLVLSDTLPDSCIYLLGGQTGQQDPSGVKDPGQLGFAHLTFAH